MKRNSLTTALIAGLAGAAGLASTASALNLNPDGLGQVLLYPYYTVNKGNSTLISVVNTTDRVKAVKVRFLEGRNSREVLDFNLYLSPFDVWTGEVYAEGATGGGFLTTDDTSCTTPRIFGNPLYLRASGITAAAFRNFQYTGTINQDWTTAGTPAALATVLGSIERTREGHVEMIEMGLLRTGTGLTRLAEEATHVAATGIPANCAALVTSWTTGTPSPSWAADGGATNVDLPTGGLFGAAQIIDPANGTLHAYNAEAIEGFYSNTAAPGRLHSAPGSILPNLEDAETGGGLIDTYVFSQNGASIVAEQFPAGVRSTSLIVQHSPIDANNYGYGLTTGGTPRAASVDAVSTLFTHDSIYNEYVTEPAIGASSEWVITFPTKNFYVNYAARTVATASGGTASQFLARAPFTDSFRDNGSACEQIGFDYWDREERQNEAPPGSVDFSPPPPAGEPTVASICYEANVVAINQAAAGVAGGVTGIFGSTYGFNINTPGPTSTFNSGWARLSFLGQTSSNPTGRSNVLYVDPSIGPTGTPLTGDPTYTRFVGLPVIGFWSVNYVNASAAPGLLANYSGAFRHRASRVCAGITGGFCNATFGP
jgi:hypothetical protein